MTTTIQSLQALYVQMGGQLTDTYSGIADGLPVSDYTLIPDMISAVTQKASSGEDEKADVLPALLYATGMRIKKQDTENLYAIDIRSPGQLGAGGMDDITIEQLHTRIDGIVSGTLFFSDSAKYTAVALQKMFKVAEAYPGAVPEWVDDDVLLGIVKIEVSDEADLMANVSQYMQGETGYDDTAKAYVTTCRAVVSFWDLEMATRSANNFTRSFSPVSLNGTFDKSVSPNTFTLAEPIGPRVLLNILDKNAVIVKTSGDLSDDEDRFSSMLSYRYVSESNKYEFVFAGGGSNFGNYFKATVTNLDGGTPLPAFTVAT